MAEKSNLDLFNALGEVEDATESSQIASQNIVDAPAGVIAETISAEIIAGGAPRLVMMSNLDNTKTVFFAIDMDAVPEAGIALAPGRQVVIPINQDRGLHAITAVSTAKLSWQSFG